MKQCLTRVRNFSLLAVLASPLACALSVEEAANLGVLEQAATCVKDSATAVTIYVSPTGSDSGAGTCNAPFKTLAKAHSHIDAQDADIDGERINSKSYTVYLRGGTYEKAVVTWQVASPDRLIRITAYPGERPVLDGKGEIANAITFAVGRGHRTRIEISDLTFRHYVQRGILLRGRYNGDDPADREYADAHWNGGSLYTRNVFERIGDVYNNVCLEKGRTRCLQATRLPSTDIARVVCMDDDVVCAGRAGIGGFNTRFNEITDNTFSYIESADDELWGQSHSRQVAHAFYVSTFSSGNLLRNNFVTHSSGSAFKLVNRCSDNIFAENYIMFSGSNAFIENLGQADDGDAPGTGNRVGDNVLLFGYPYRDSYVFSGQDVSSRSSYVVVAQRVEPGFSSAYNFIQDSASFHEGRRARYQRVGGMALGDVDNDARPELFVAFNYPEFGIGTIARTGLVGAGQYLNRSVFWSKEWQVNGLTIGRFETSRPATLVSNLHKVDGGANRTELWRGSGFDRRGAQDINRIYGNDAWRVTALAAGDFDDNGIDELLAAFKSDGGTRRVYRGGGISSIGSSIYESTTWDILAMAAPRIAGRDNIYTSFKRSTSSGYEARLYRGNGVTSVTGDGSLVSATNRYFASLAAQSPTPLEPARLFAGTAYNAGHTSMDAYTLDGAADGEVAIETTGVFRHAAYGAVANLPKAVISVHERVFTAPDTSSRVEISGTNGVTFNAFEPSPVCDPEIWECE